MNEVLVEIDDASKTLIVEETLTSGSKYRVVVKDGAERVGTGDLIVTVPPRLAAELPFELREPAPAVAALAHLTAAEPSSDGVLNTSTDVLQALAMKCPRLETVFPCVLHSDTNGENVATGSVRIRLCEVASGEPTGAAVLYRGPKGEDGKPGKDGERGAQGAPCTRGYVFDEDGDGKWHKLVVHTNKFGEKLIDVDPEGVDAPPADEWFVGLDTTQDITGQKRVVATGSSVFRSIQDRFADTNNVIDFGAKGDGVTDDTEAIRRAIAASSGKILFFPKGNYVVDPRDLPISLGDIHIVGIGVQESDPPYCDNGSCISVVPTDRSVPPFLLGQRVTIEGMTFYYPGQDGSSVDPVQFAATFRCRGDIQSKYIVFRNNTVVNAFKFIEVPEARQPGTTLGFVGDWRIESSRIYSVFCDIDFGCSMDESSFITNNLFSFGVAHGIAVENGGNLARWTARNGCHIRIAADGGSVDNLNVQNNNFFGAFDGILVKSGKISICSIANNLFDMTPHPLRVIESGTVDCSVFKGNIVTSKSYAGDVGYGDAIVIRSSAAIVDIKGNRIQNAPSSAIFIESAGVVFANISGNEIWNFAHTPDAVDRAGVRMVETGQHGGGGWSILTLANNDFYVTERPSGRTGADVGIDISTNHATITGNSFYGCETCISVAVADNVLVAANRSVMATTGIGGAWAAGVESYGNAWH